jgi:hypothetical protein
VFIGEAGEVFRDQARRVAWKHDDNPLAPMAATDAHSLGRESRLEVHLLGVLRDELKTASFQ